MVKVYSIYQCAEQEDVHHHCCKAINLMSMRCSCKTVIVVCRSLYVSMLNSVPCFACAEQREQPSQAVIGVRTEPAGHVGASENAKLPAGKAAAAVRPQRPRAGGSAWPENDVSARKTFSFAHKGCAASLAGCLIDMNPPPELCSSV